MIVAALGDRELVEILFPRTKPIASLPNWSVDGIIDTMKYLPLKAQVCNLFLSNFEHNLYYWILMAASSMFYIF